MKKRSLMLTGGLLMFVATVGLASPYWAVAQEAAAQEVQGTVRLNAAGATFPYPIYAKWFDVYHKEHPNIEINYNSIGSGGGIQQTKARTVDFGASDMPLGDSLLNEIGFKIIQFPTVLGAVVPTYNVSNVSEELKFTPEALAGIYLGKITRWNDPRIAGPNPGVKLPNAAIVVVHRSDGSGTTFVWTDYLSKVSPEWKQNVGSNTSVNWPAGLGGKGNEGVAGLVKQTPNSIGYVELIYAIQNHMPYGDVQNSSGKFIKASLPAVTAAGAGVIEQMKQDVRVSITNPPGEDAYPISSFTYLLIPARIEDAQKRQVITSFLSWMLQDGQQFAGSLGYAPLPDALRQIELQNIAQIQ